MNGMQASCLLRPRRRAGIVAISLIGLLTVRTAAAQTSGQPPATFTFESAVSYALAHYPAVQAALGARWPPMPASVLREPTTCRGRICCGKATARPTIISSAYSFPRMSCPPSQDRYSPQLPTAVHGTAPQGFWFRGNLSISGTGPPWSMQHERIRRRRSPEPH